MNSDEFSPTVGLKTYDVNLESIHNDFFSDKPDPVYFINISLNEPLPGLYHARAHNAMP